MFVLDGTIKDKYFLNVLNFVEGVVENLNVGIGKTRVGLLQFSTWAHTEFDLNSYNTKDEIIDHIRNIHPIKGYRNLYAGLNSLVDNMFR